jgi:hypothetical protein
MQPELTTADLAYIQTAIDTPEVLEVPEPSIIRRTKAIVLHCADDQQVRDVLADVKAEGSMRVSRVYRNHIGGYHVYIKEREVATT